MDMAMFQSRTGTNSAHASLDAIVNRWFDHEVDFSKLTTDNVTTTKVCPSGEVVSIFLPSKLYRHIDVLNWLKINAPEFPPIAIMARVYLSLELSSSYQERIFSNGGFVCDDWRQSLQDERCENLFIGKANRQINRRRHKK